MTPRINALLFATGLFVFVTNLFGQVQYPDTAPSRGVAPVGAYSFDKFETINKATGGLTYSIPLTSMPLGRGGMSLPINLTYNSTVFDYTYSWTFGTQPPYPPFLYQTLTTDVSSGWSLTARYGITIQQKPVPSTATYPCNTGTGIVQSYLLMPDGSRHVLQFPAFPEGFTGGGDGFYPWDYTGHTACANFPSLTGVIKTFTSDGSFIKVSVDQSTGITVASLPNGSTITWTASGAQVIADRNGNKITDTFNWNANTNTYYELLTDDLGRTVKILAQTAGGWQVTQTGYSNASLFWTFGSAPNSNWTAFQFNYICQNSQSAAGQSVSPKTCLTSGSGGGTDMLQVPSNDPAHPLTYTFQYQPLTGLLQTVTLPSGASTTYGYQCNNYAACFTLRTDLLNPVTSKVVSWIDQSDGGSTPRRESWSWAYGTNPSYPNALVTTTPDNGQELTYFANSFVAGGPPAVETRDVQPNGDSVDYFYEYNRPYGLSYGYPNPYVTATIRTVAQGGNPALSSVTLYQTDKNGNQVSVSTYDWSSYSTANRGAGGVLTVAPTASGTLLKKVQNTYTVSTAALAGTGNESISDDTNGYWNINSPRFLHLLQSSKVSGPGPGALDYYTYDGNGNPLSVAKWDSSKAATQPSPQNLTRSNASVTNWTWDSTYTGNLRSETDPNGNVTTYTYDGNNLYLFQKVQASNTSALARTFTYGWDQNLGLLISNTDTDNNLTTSYSYDGTGRQTQMIEASNISGLARQTNTTYFDAARQVVVQRDQIKSGDSTTTGGLTSATNYDQLYRVALTQELESPTPRVTSPLTTTIGIKVQTRYMYSGNNSYKLVSNPYRASTSSAASGEQTMGWVMGTADQNGRLISTQSFNGAGLPSIWGGGNTSSSGAIITTYNLNPGNATRITDQANNARLTYVDGAGRLTGVTEALGYNTIYAYDALDNLICVNQNVSSPSGTCSQNSAHGRSFVYDSLKRLQTATNPENGTITYLYDSDGNLRTKTDNRGVTTTYTPDALNRVSAKSYSDGTTPSVTYNYGTLANPVGSYSVGKLVSVVSGDSTTTYSNFDALGRAQSSSQVTGGQTFTFGYTYNISSLIAERYPSGRTITTNLDGASRESGVTGLFGGMTTNYVGSVAYAAHGAPQSFQYGQVSASLGKVVRTNTYNPRLQLTHFTEINNSTGISLLNATLDWGTTNNNGNLRDATYVHGGTGTPSSLSFTQTYLYDAVNRLTSVTDTSPTPTGATTTNYSRSFGFDAYGNMWVTASSGINPLGNTPDTINAFTANNQISGTSYDQAGNQTMVNGNTQTYDAENRQISVRFAGASEFYVYDGSGKRVEKAGASGTTVFVYDAMGRMAAEYSTVANNSPCATCYLSTDHLGTTRVVVDGSGNLVARHDFLPFGEEIVVNTAGRNSQWGTGNDTVNQKFTGQERDSESGLDYFGSRYFGSALGRFTTADRPFTDQHAANPQSWNLYVYGRNNPLRNIDAGGFKVIPSDFAQATAAIKAIQGNGGGILYLDFAGIRGLHFHESITLDTFAKWHADHKNENSVVLKNNSKLFGFPAALIGKANRDQVDTGKAILEAVNKANSVADAPKVRVGIDTYSNGVNAGGAVAAGMAPGTLQSATVVAPNANSSAPVNAMDAADGGTTQIYVSEWDPALNIALDGSQLASDWLADFGDRVHVTEQASHNMDRYWEANFACANYNNPSACGIHQPLNPMGPP